MQIYWAPFLHIYQPPWQDVEILRKIDSECYRPLFTMLKRHPNARVTLNIQGCLLDMLHNVGLYDTLILLKDLIKMKRVELVGSGKFHPILPLIPKKERKRQIHLNESTLQEYFPNDWERKGFFPPEMAIDPKILPDIQAIGYKWIIGSGIANNPQNPWPHDYIQKHSSGLLTFYRDDYVSNDIAFQKIDAQQFIEKLHNMYPNGENNYVITAMDGETFGHHIPFYETTFLGKVFSLIEDDPNIQISFISDLHNIFPVKQIDSVRSSTWSTDGSDIASNVPYPLWKHPFNPVHKVQFRMLKNLYRLMDLMEENAPDERKNIDIKLTSDNPKENNKKKEIDKGKDKEEVVKSEKKSLSSMSYCATARYFYDRALHSCWLWWASMRPHWSPNLIYKGVDLVLKTALNAQLGLINLKIGQGDEPYANIMDNTEKLMTTLIELEAAGQKVRTF